MAQKQFKIGLSNTDKQNMAQDVYERLLALTFPEYDTTESYEIGYFVVYNDQLYKCIGATSGAWDSTKWQLATLNDLLTDIEGAVAFVNDKANVDGNYPTMTVGMADNLTPYDESAGDDQDEPFSFQVTGTGNGIQPDFSTGSAGLMKEKQGNTVVVNQFAKELNATNWYVDGGSTITFNNGIATFTASKIYARMICNYKPVLGHKYILMADIKNSSNNSISLVLGTGSSFTSQGCYVNSSESNIKFCVIRTFRVVGTDDKLFIMNLSPTAEIGAIEVSNIFIIDLTQWFNGDIPQDILDNPSNFFRYYQGSLAYNEGTLVNANGRYIKCIGMNQWDEEWELGYINSSTGQNENGSTTIRSKNYIRVNPNTQYYFKRNNIVSNLFEYDSNFNFIKLNGSPNVFTTSPNCYYIKFYMSGDYGTTYNNDISINLYYEDEPRCLTYEPYKVLTNNDTGTEVLRKAGNVADIKLPDGTIKRNVGVVDLGTLTWTYNDAWGFWEAVNQVSDRKYADASDVGNISCSNYVALAWNSVVGGNINGIASPLGGSRGFIVRNGSSTTEPSGTLYYELAEPTTEQGTPYSENLVIDDFGSMDFGSDVPQGANIFYPVDYKAFVDTLYKYTDGTPSNIALKSDVASEQSARESVDTQLLNAVGGTLRQCLCVKESLDFDNTAFVDLGTLNWLYSTLDGNAAFTATISGAKTTSKTISTRYEKQDGYQTTNKTYTLQRGEAGTIWVIDNSYTDAVAFKAAVQGVIVAFEKA